MDSLVSLLRKGESAPPQSEQQKEALALLAAGGVRVRVYAPKPDLLKGISPERLVQLHTDLAATEKNAMAVLSGKLPADTAIPFPTEAWATRVFPCLAPHEALARLWQALARSFLLELDDPAQAWSQRIRHMDSLLYFIEGRRLRTLTLRGRSTELQLSLEPSERWFGGTIQGTAGHGFHTAFPIGGLSTGVAPSGTSGHVHINRPLALAGENVSGLDLQIQDGLVTLLGAKEGGDTLQAFFDHSPATRNLAAITLPVPVYYPVSSDQAFCNPIMDRTTAHGLTLTDPSIAGSLRIDLFFDDDALTVEGTNEKGETHRLDILFRSPEVLADRRKAAGMPDLSHKEYSVGELDEQLRHGLKLLENGQTEVGVAALTVTANRANECFRRGRLLAHDWESKYRQMDLLSIAKDAHDAIDKAERDRH